MSENEYVFVFKRVRDRRPQWRYPTQASLKSAPTRSLHYEPDGNQ